MDTTIRIGKGAKIGLVILLHIVLIFGTVLSFILISAFIEGRSFGSKVFELALKIFLSAKAIRTEKKTMHLIERAGRRNENYKVPCIYKKLYGFEPVLYENTELCCFGREDAKTVIYYISGGVFLFQPTLFHYRYCRRLAEKLDARVIMPVYPKAPNYTHTHTMDYLYRLYKKLVADKPCANFVIMGDSSGGSLALTLGQIVAEKGARKPKNIIALSPCLDMTLSNPEISNYKMLDLMLNADDILLKYRSYFGQELYDKSYLVSPMYCDFELLPKVTIFAGIHEMFLPDMRILKEMLYDKGIPLDYHEYGNMDHAFALLPIPEANEVLAHIKDTITA